MKGIVSLFMLHKLFDMIAEQSVRSKVRSMALMIVAHDSRLVGRTSINLVVRRL
jgi:hypothetical protein